MMKRFEDLEAQTVKENEAFTLPPLPPLLSRRRGNREEEDSLDAGVFDCLILGTRGGGGGACVGGSVWPVHEAREASRTHWRHVL